MQPPCLQLGMQLAVACNYLCNFLDFCNFFRCVCNYDHLHPNLWMISVDIYYRIYTFGCILSYIFDMHILIVACATKIGQLWSFGELGTHFIDITRIQRRRKKPVLYHESPVQQESKESIILSFIKHPETKLG